jgi:hypothetical protein
MRTTPAETAGGFPEIRAQLPNLTEPVPINAPEISMRPDDNGSRSVLDETCSAALSVTCGAI